MSFEFMLLGAFERGRLRGTCISQQISKQYIVARVTALHASALKF